jgi:hypothetical protein
MRPPTLLASFALLISACGTSADLEVERATADGYETLLVETWSIDGQRDGARTRALVTMTLNDGRELQLELVLAYDPAPVLAEGNWSSDGSGGTVLAEAVRFVGGQGDGPSIGGLYLMLEDGEPRFRVKLRLTRIATPTPEF